MKHINREAWLNAGIVALRPHFAAVDYVVPDNVRVTCGFPSKGALPRKGGMTRGQCWSDTASEGKVFEIFLSPFLAEPATVLLVLSHELVHATVGLAANHGKLFKRCANAIGLVGKMRTATPSPELEAALAGIAQALGAYPHQELKHMTTGVAKQPTRLLKAECGPCGYTVRVTRKWVDTAGAPLCPDKHCDNWRRPLQVDA